jgi:hypothetical protein
MTLININRNGKGGDAYGKVPKLIAIAISKGAQENAWPGQKYSAKGSARL